MAQVLKGSSDQRVQVSSPFGRKKRGTMLCLDARLALRLKELGILFTPTIDKSDVDSTRSGGAEFQKLGYQRPPEVTRIKKIAAYYADEDILGFTTPLIVSVRKGLDSSVIAALIERALAGDMNAIDQLKHSLAIIDGQHRAEGALLAAASLDEDLELDVVLVLIHGLAYDEETEEFNVINTTPKRLPKALVEWNRYGITEEAAVTSGQEIRKIAVQLATDESSPWFDSINLTGTGREPGRPVTLEGMRRSTDNMLKAGGLRHQPFQVRYELVKAYWTAIAETFSDAWEDVQPLVQMPDGSTVIGGGTWENEDGDVVKVPRTQYRIKELVGVAALAKLGGDILAEALGNTDRLNYVSREVEKLADVNWEKRDDNPWVKSQAGFAGQKDLYEAIAYLRARGVAPWEELA